MKSKETWDNRAVSTGDASDVSLCGNCDETLVFAMKDQYHEFSIGLQTILKCLEIAETEGYVPPLPPEWWWKVH